MVEVTSDIALQTGPSAPADSIAEFPKRNGIVERIFQPIEQTDQFGFKRRVYHHGDISFSFRGRNEHPIIPEISQSRSALLGSTSAWIDTQDFQDYKNLVEGRNIEVQAPRHYIVTKDIQGFIELMSLLDPNNTQFNTKLDEIKHGVYSDEVLAMVDSLIACNFIDEEQTQWKIERGRSGADAEATVVASLLDDNEATQYIKQQREKMTKLEEARIKQFIAEHEEAWSYSEKWKPPNIDDLVGVHATKYYPRRTDNGYAIATTGEARDWTVFRNTCHITLNHKVQGHYGGHWDQTPYTIVAPFKLMLEANGNPIAIAEYDTWWTRNPGESLKFPDASLVGPGNPSAGLLFEIRGNNTIVKAENYTLEDLVKFEAETGRSYLWEDFQAVLLPWDPNDIDDDWDKQRLCETFIQKYFPDSEEAELATHFGTGGPHHRSFGNFFKASDKTILVKGRVLQLLKDADLAKFYKREPDKFAQAFQALCDRVSTNIERRLFSEINEMAIRETVKSRGFPMSENLKGQVGSLGRIFNASTDSAAHSNSSYHVYEALYANAISEAKHGDMESKEFDWSKFNLNFSLASVDDRMKRVVYVSGVTNARM